MLTLTEAEFRAILTQAVDDAVKVALADYAKKHEAELRAWKLAAVAGGVGAFACLAWAAAK